RIPLAVTVTHRDRPTPCLDYHIKQCCGPCIGCVTPDAYHKDAIEGVIDFLKGKTDDALRLLSERMKAVARERKFEQAAKLRDAMQTIQRLSEKQIVSDTSGEDADVFGVAVEGNRVHVVLLKERNGKVIDESSFTLLGHAENVAEALAQFLPQYYLEAPDVPPLLLLPEEIDGQNLLQKWLTDRRGTHVTIHVPERGKKNKLLALAEENAQEKVQHFETSWEAKARNVEDALKELKAALGLPAVPKRIEGYDISHLSGTETVGSMSVFIDGKPKNDQYRSYTIRTIREGDIDDYRAIKEVLRRRLLHLKQDVKQEERQLKQEGIVIRKSRKTDLKTIERIVKAHPQEIDDANIRSGGFLLAEREKKIIAFCRLHQHKDKTLELASLFVEKKARGRKLGHLLARKLMRPLKKGKVYIEIRPDLQEYYAELGFQPVHTAPAPIIRKALRCQKRFGEKTPALYMMAEVRKQKPDPSLTSLPDLLLIDGGKGQLSAAEEILRELQQNIPVISLAKREEEVFVTGNPQPLSIIKDSPARFLLMRLRDEAHRFANAHRETRAKKRAVFSVLDSIPGIGPQTRVKLLKRFGSLEALKGLKDEELAHILSESQIRALREAI
ncbi:MAG: GNAT family N-acetyltransferase, partial [Candidatus Peribacter sp.]|nr:GNAT family N-acetyltransferase [Candidatus Peribacter sp.]